MMPDHRAEEAGPLSSAGPAAAGLYRVLARRHRPQRLSELIGQDALVRTLGNALRTGRIAHAFLLTGIRGVGKTSTARIIARALNCIGPDGQGEPTPEPCGVCEPCVAIAESRHIDVLEMDAATRTGIDDIREIVEGVRYAPITARQVEDMLGLADRGRVLDLFELVMRGDIKAALDRLGELHDLGTEPEIVVQELLEISHWLTRIKVVPAAAPARDVAGADAARA